MSFPGYIELEPLASTAGIRTVRAIEETSSRKVTIRSLESDRPDSIVSDRFFVQHQYLLRQQHENILEVYLSDQDHFVLEEVACNLSTLTGQRNLQADEVGSVLAQLLSVVEMLERKGESHGDLRPSALYLGSDERTVKVADFWNIDRVRLPDESLTRYCAPELLNESEFGSPEGASIDLYHVGYAALEMLLGEDEFVSLFRGVKTEFGQGLSWFQWHASDEPARSLRELRPDWPDEIVAVVDGLTEKRIRNRIRTAGEALERLGRWERVHLPFELAAADSGADAAAPSQSVCTITFRAPKLSPKRIYGRGPVLIGRSKEVCDVVLRAKSISRKHVVLGSFLARTDADAPPETNWLAVDISGRDGAGGLQVNGKPTRQRSVRDGDELTIGGVPVTVSIDADTAVRNPELPSKIEGFRFYGPPIHVGRLGSYYAGSWADEGNRLVAILHARPEITAELRLWDRLDRDLRRTASSDLRHPNIVRYFRAFRPRMQTFLMIDWMDGGSLRDRLSRSDGRLDLPTLRETGDRMIAALRFLHERGVVHRNIDPSSILFDHRGRAMLGGLLFAYMSPEEHQAAARSLSLEVNEHELFETVYRSPESTRGGDPTPEWDLYALAACLFQGACGRPPYAGATPREVIGNILTGRRRTLREVDSKLPKSLDAFFDKALASEPAFRPATGAEFADAWAEACAGL